MQLSAVDDRPAVQTVGELEAFPCQTYAEFLEGYRSGTLKVWTRYNGPICLELGATSDRVKHYMLTWSPFIMSALLVLLFFRSSNYVFLFGIPLAILGLLFSSPTMKGVQTYILFFSVAFFIGAWGNWPWAMLPVSYVVPYFLCAVARNQCDMLIREAISESETILVWLYQSGIVVVRRA